MTEFAAALEATAFAQHLKISRWTYPAVNAGHLLGIALLLGAVLPMDMAVLRGRGAAATALLRSWAVAGFVIAAACGALLFITQAGDYTESTWFLAKALVLLLALANAGYALLPGRSAATRRRAAVLSFILWPTVLVLGRFVGYS